MEEGENGSAWFCLVRSLYRNVVASLNLTLSLRYYRVNDDDSTNFVVSTFAHFECSPLSRPPRRSSCDERSVLIDNERARTNKESTRFPRALII